MSLLHPGHVNTKAHKVNNTKTQMSVMSASSMDADLGGETAHMPNN